MPSERIQRQIDGLLDEAEAAVKQSNWALVRDRIQNVLALDPENSDALAYQAAADRILGSAAGPAPTAPPPAPAPADASASFASPPPAPPAPPPDPTPAPGPEPLQPGTQSQPASFANGRYQVKRFLGEGGKKKVFLVYDTLLDRDVAFALIKTVGLDEEGLTRIRREAQAMGRLGDHPHVVSVYDVGQDGPSAGSGSGQAPQPYLVSQLMSGGDVEGLLEKTEGHRLPLEQAVRIADEVCQALEHAHAHGIVHRDLKPGNVWLTQDGTAKLGDFGLAVALDRSRLTRAGMMVGTVAYMPPEQALGGQVVPQSDLYSLGAMLYEMVTGRPPFVGKEGVALISQHLSTPPEPPSRHRPDLPPALEELILALLEKDPARRPASATAVRQALAAIDLSQSAAPTEAGAASPEAARRQIFVGREAELRQAQTAFDNAASGHGSLLLVVGETGIGKTALVEQVCAYAAVRGGLVLKGECDEESFQSASFQPLAEALRSFVQDRPADALREDLGPGVGDLAGLTLELRERLELPAVPEGRGDRTRIVQSAAAFLRRASTRQPLLLVLEDLHWADRGTLDLLTHLARNVSAVRLMVVGTYRDVGLDRGHPLTGFLADLRRAVGLGRIQLGGLPTDGVRDLIARLTDRGCPWSLAEAVYRQTEGNPLFVHEVVRFLEEEGLLRPEVRWRLRSTETLLRSIPEGLQDVIARRLAGLSPECLRVLAVAAVIGREFPLEVLEKVTDVPEDQLYAALEGAKTAWVVAEQAAARGQVTYRFVHTFYRQQLYQEIIAPRRIRLHQQVARAIEQLYTGHLDGQAAALAEHFSHSSDPTDLDRAVTYGDLAARRAVARGDHLEAVRFLDQALQVEEAREPQDPAKRCDLLLALGESLGPAGDPLRAVEEVAPTALALAESVGDGVRAFRACRLALDAMGRFGAATMGGTAVWRQWAERADGYATPGSAGQVHADLALALVRYAEGRWGAARELYGRALEVARQLGDPELLGLATLRNMQGAWGPEQAEARLKLAEELSPQMLQEVGPVTAGLLAWFGGTVFLNWGRRERAEELWRQAGDLAERTRSPSLLLHRDATETLVAALDGKLSEAVAAGGRLVSRADELGMPVFGRYLAANATLRALLHLGRTHEALAALPEASQLAGVEDSPRRGPQRALCLAYLGQVEQARAAMASALGQVAGGSAADEMPAEFLTLWLETAVIVEDRETAVRLAGRLAGLARLAMAGIDPVGVARLLGAAAALAGDGEGARAHYELALKVATEVRCRPEVALTRLNLAELSLGNREQGTGSEEQGRREALEHLDFATSEFQTMRMQPALQRALRHRGLLKA